MSAPSSLRVPLSSLRAKHGNLDFYRMLHNQIAASSAPESSRPPRNDE
jgi:hypothetical protein